MWKINLRAVGSDHIKCLKISKMGRAYGSQLIFDHLATDCVSGIPLGKPLLLK